MHQNSKDGWGVFNWRMKFQLELPECQYPRIRISVLDFEVIGGSEGIGTAVISLRKLLKKLKEDGRLKLDRKRVPFSHPNFPG